MVETASGIQPFVTLGLKFAWTAGTTQKVLKTVSGSQAPLYATKPILYVPGVLNVTFIDVLPFILGNVPKVPVTALGAIIVGFSIQSLL